MTRDGIKQILPHREPMLLVDEASAENGQSRGSYTVRGDEWFLQGHFPGNPVVPGVILCEMMAQSACVILSEKIKGKTPYFAGMNNVRFKLPARPGDTVMFTCRLAREMAPFYFLEGEGHIDGRLCVKGEFSFAVM